MIISCHDARSTDNFIMLWSNLLCYNYIEPPLFELVQWRNLCHFILNTSSDEIFGKNKRLLFASQRFSPTKFLSACEACTVWNSKKNARKKASCGLITKWICILWWTLTWNICRNIYLIHSQLHGSWIKPHDWIVTADDNEHSFISRS